MQQQKPFWKSVSFWVVTLTALSVVLDKAIAGGLIPDTGWAAIVSAVIGLVLKRGLVDAATVKAGAIIEASKNANPPPPQG
jgi:hypothetical protein